MAKKAYKSPIFFQEGGITVDDDPHVHYGPSQGTSGYDSMWTFSGIDQATLDMIDLNCDDIDLQDMDSDGNYIITKEEFDIWYADHGTW